MPRPPLEQLLLGFVPHRLDCPCERTAPTNAACQLSTDACSCLAWRRRIVDNQADALRMWMLETDA